MRPNSGPIAGAEAVAGVVAGIFEGDSKAVMVTVTSAVPLESVVSERYLAAVSGVKSERSVVIFSSSAGYGLPAALTFHVVPSRSSTAAEGPAAGPAIVMLRMRSEASRSIDLSRREG